jgi:Trypsin-like peptidase domain/Effector-associated domain 1
VFYGLNTNIESVSAAESLSVMLAQLIEWANARGATAELVTAALRTRPDNPALQAVADELGLTSSFISPEELAQLTVSLAAAGVADAAAWRRVGAEMAGRVCRIDVVAPAVAGTGFLIARDLVLTAHSVVAKALEVGAPGAAIAARFDYREVQGAEVDPGIQVAAARDWLVAHDRDLDFAVLRLLQPIADEPVGGDRAVPNAPPRGWVALPSAPAAFSGLVVILQHPRAGPLKIAFDPSANVDASGAFVQYRAATEAGSAGAPCFSADWQLVAMHQGRSPTLTQWNLKRGIAIDRIVERLPFELFRSARSADAASVKEGRHGRTAL